MAVGHSAELSVGSCGVGDASELVIQSPLGRALDEREAASALEAALFPAVRGVNYQPLAQALAAGHAAARPVHAVVLWGALLDASC